MPYTTPLEKAAAAAAAKVRSKILRTSHERYPWLFISPKSKEDVSPVVQLLLEDNAKLESISIETGITFPEDPWDAVEDYYPVVSTRGAGTTKPPFPGRFLVIVGLEYVDHNNGFPNIKEGLLYPGEYVVVSGDKGLHLTEEGGGASLFILLKPN